LAKVRFFASALLNGLLHPTATIVLLSPQLFFGFLRGTQAQALPL
jgi:hypothetical protein